jgi:hypothetical protein
MNYVFALDTSLEAVQTGLLSSACNIIMEMVYGSPFNVQTEEEGEEPPSAGRTFWNPESKLTIITYDREICFYDFVVSNTSNTVV